MSDGKPHKWWTAEEKRILARDYGSGGSNIPELAYRGRTAIRRKAFKLGIKTAHKISRTNWTQEEVELVIRYYPSLNIPELNRTKGAIKNKQQSLGLTPTQQCPIGTKRINRNGYVETKVKNGCPVSHRFTKTGEWCREHRLIWWDAHPEDRGLLLNGATLHHINGDRADNSIENLELWINNHRPGQRVQDIIKERAYQLIEELGYIRE